jgi:hypothetical protein
MVRTQNQNAEWRHCIKIYNNSFESVEKFKFWGRTLRNKNSIQEENHSTLHSGNVCCHSMKHLLSSSLLPKTTKIMTLRTVILSIVFMGMNFGLSNWRRNTCWVRFRVRCWGEYLGLRGTKLKKSGYIYIYIYIYNEELNDLYSSPNIQLIKSRRIRWGWLQQVKGRGEVHTVFRWSNLRERDHLEDPGIDGRIIWRWIFRKWVVRAWCGSG